MKFNTESIEFFAQTEVVVIGQNSEMADMSNPRGDIFAYAAYVIAEDNKGNRKALHMKTDKWSEQNCLPYAEDQARFLNIRFAKGNLPVAFDTWKTISPCYGSDAYVAYGSADDIDWEKQQEEMMP